MSDLEKNLTDHSYDGIQEFDNPLPGWWKWIFVGTMIYSVGYLMFYHLGADGRSIFDEYQVAVAANLRQQFQEIGELKPDKETVVKYSHDPKWLVVGQSVFKSNCVSCHGSDGQGLVGPNLTDDYYKNVTKIEDISKVISDGAAGQAMPAWKTRLHPNELVLVSSYIASIRGKNLPGPKGHEGKEIPAWDEGSASEKPPIENRWIRVDPRTLERQSRWSRLSSFLKSTSYPHWKRMVRAVGCIQDCPRDIFGTFAESWATP